MKELKFTESEDWVTHNIPIWKKHLGPYVGKTGVKGLEIGTWQGRSANWLLENILTGKNSSLVTIDRDHSRFRENQAIIEAAHPGRLVAIQSDAFEWMIGYSGEPFHFIYLDGPKDAGDLIDQAVMCWRILQPGGVLIFDDYLWPGQGPTQFENPPRHYSNPPRIGIDAFLQTHYLQYDLLHKGWQIIVRKKWAP